MVLRNLLIYIITEHAEKSNPSEAISSKAPMGLQKRDILTSIALDAYQAIKKRKDKFFRYILLLNEMCFAHEMIGNHEIKRKALHEMMPSASLNEICPLMLMSIDIIRHLYTRWEKHPFSF